MLLNILALTEKEIEAGETVPIEMVMAEFGVEASQAVTLVSDGRRNLAPLLARRLIRSRAKD